MGDDYSDFFSNTVDLLSLDTFSEKRPSPQYSDVRVETPQFWNRLESGVIKKVVSDILE